MSTADRVCVRDHPDLFFPDGNIVIFVGTEFVTAFCLHRQTLSGCSENLQSMITGLKGNVTYNGRDVLKINENELDFGLLVRAIYEGNTSLPTECTSESFPHLASVILLSLKYGVTRVFDYARDILLAAYPLTLSSWDIREAYRFTLDVGHNRPQSVRRHAPPLAVVSLALQLDAPQLLVPAYLDLARLPVSEIISGFTTTTYIANHPPGVTLHLRPRQVAAVLKGKESLQRVIALFIKSEVESRSSAPQCLYINQNINVRISPCAVAFARVSHQMLVTAADITGGADSDPLFLLKWATEVLEKGSNSGDSTEAGACASCVNLFYHSVCTARQQVWGSLDKWFDLRAVLENGFEAGGWE